MRAGRIERGIRLRACEACAGKTKEKHEKPPEAPPEGPSRGGVADFATSVTSKIMLRVAGFFHVGQLIRVLKSG